MLPALDALVVRHDPAANARAADPVTSFVAAKMAREFAGTQCDTIHACLREHGTASKDGIAVRTRLDATAVARRLADLQKQGRAAPTGDTRMSVSGRPERIWRAI
jgi:predicted ArsR family transcriptional regulator